MAQEAKPRATRSSRGSQTQSNSGRPSVFVPRRVNKIMAEDPESLDGEIITMFRDVMRQAGRAVSAAVAHAGDRNKANADALDNECSLLADMMLEYSIEQTPPPPQEEQ